MIAAFALAMPAAAEECVPSTSNAYYVPPHYLDFSCFADHPDTCDTICPLLLVPYGVFCTMWLYDESNDIVGLQRGDEVHDDTCGGMIEADTIVY